MARDPCDQQALTISATAPAEFQQFLLDEVDRWARVVREAKIKAEE